MKKFKYTTGNFQKDARKFDRKNGNSGLVELMDAALALPEGGYVRIQPGWEAEGSARSTASRLPRGEISGKYWGRSDLFNARYLENPDVPGYWTVDIWKKEKEEKE